MAATVVRSAAATLKVPYAEIVVILLPCVRGRVRRAFGFWWLYQIPTRYLPLEAAATAATVARLMAATLKVPYAEIVVIRALRLG